MIPWVPILAPCSSHGLLTSSSPRESPSIKSQVVLQVFPSQASSLARTQEGDVYCPGARHQWLICSST